MGVCTVAVDPREMLDVITRIQTVMSVQGPVPAVFDDLLESLLSYTQSEYGFIGHLVHPSDGEPFLKSRAITNIAWTEDMRAWVQANAPDGLEFKNNDTLFGHTVRTGEWVFANGPRSHPASRGLPAGHPPLETYMGIPIFSGGELVGMAGVANRVGGYDRILADEIEPLILTVGQALRVFLEHQSRRAAEAEMRRAMLEATRAAEAKSNFLSMMSHEIRTPMNGVLGMVQVLAGDDLTGPQLERVETIKQSAMALLRILDDVLDFSKIEANRLDYERAVFDPRPTLTDTVRLLEAAAEDKEISLEVDLGREGAVSALVKADQARLRQILLNLTSNAIKFTHRGGVTLKLFSDADDVYLSVRDTGVGVPEAAVPRLFEAFTQAEASTSRRYGGTGLGLAISRRLARGMHGELTYRPNPEGGSIFTVRLPRHTPRTGEFVISPEAEVTADEVPQALMRQEIAAWDPCVLVAEDNAINQRVISALLKRLGVASIVVENGKLAVEAVRAGGIDLVLMDGHMPVLDGYDATKQIRAWERANEQVRTPIVALTANSMAGERSRCIDLGMDDFLAKPLVIPALVNSLYRLALRRRRRPSAQRSRGA